MSTETLPAPVAPPRHGDPVTSHQAYKRLKPEAQQAVMLRGYYRLGDDGGTADEALEASGGYAGRAYWHRSTDLRDGGFIEDTDDVRRNPDTGMPNQVRVITARGVAEVYRLGMYR